MKVLVCGSSGLLGSRFYKYLIDNNVECVGTYNTNKIYGGIQVNFSDIQCIKNAINTHSITVCVNCIVERRVDVCEENWNETKKTNIDITNNIAKVCGELGIHLIHISTDYVFDGTEAPYTPESRTNPLQNYGISKLVSEMRVQRHCPIYTIIRVPVLYSEHVKTLSDSAVTVIGKKVLDRTKEYREDNFSIRRPLYIDDLCPFMYECITQRHYSLQHFGNPQDRVTKYEMSKFIANYLQKHLNVTPVNEAPDDGADRPIDTQLVTSNCFANNFTSVQEGLVKCFSKFWHPRIVENPKDIFLLIDLDGTLVDTDGVHHEAYRRVLGDAAPPLDSNVDEFLHERYTDEEFKMIKESKLDEMLKMDNIKFMKNADTFIEFIHKLGINHCVVTNTNKRVVEHFKQKLPTLNLLHNWITREDYKLAKPNSECYELAIHRHKGDEKYIIGFENSKVGYDAVKQVTECVYLINENMKSEDAYIINDFLQCI